MRIIRGYDGWNSLYPPELGDIYIPENGAWAVKLVKSTRMPEGPAHEEWVDIDLFEAWVEEVRSGKKEPREAD